MISAGFRIAIAIALITQLQRSEGVTAHAQGQRPLAVSISPSAVRLGDVVRIEVTGVARPPVTATLMGQTLQFWFDDRINAWTALAGIDLESAPGTYALQIRSNDAHESAHVVRVLPKTFRLRRLRVAEAFVNPPEAALEQIRSDSALLAEAYAHLTPRRWEGAFRLPVAGNPSSNFGVRSYYNGEPRSPHAGVDFTSETGTPVAAANSGTVTLAAPLYFTGNTIIIDHGARLFTLYAHLSALRVRTGDQVTPDTVIGLVGATGRVTGPHLHWSVRLNGARVDPLSLIDATRLR